MKNKYIILLTLVFVLSCSCSFTKDVLKTDEYISTETGNNIAKSLQFEGTYKNEKYVFLRLYDVFYNDDYQVANILKAAISVLGPAPDGLYYSHVAISCNLKDDFVGMTSGKENNARHECLSTPETNRYINSNDPSKSRCTVIAIPCSEADYENCKALIEYSTMPGSKFYFGLTDFIGIVSTRASNIHKIKKTPLDNSSIKDTEPILTPEEEFASRCYCCSAFCSYILIHGIQRYKDYAEKLHLNYRGVTPADLYSVQGARPLFNCYYPNYDNALSEFIEQYPEFAEYL